jgi:exodeoxyribonuclease VII small subunit
MSEKAKNNPSKESETGSFEERLKRLEEISEAIRGGEVELEKATSLFEEGIRLAQSLEKELSSVEGRIEKLVKAPSQPGEKPVLELFPELSASEE